MTPSVEGNCGLPEISDFTDQQSNDIIAGLMSWIDSSIAFSPSANSFSRNSRTAFNSNRSVFLQNVFVRGAGSLIVAPHGVEPTIANTSQWTRVIALAHGENPGLFDLNLMVIVPTLHTTTPTTLNNNNN